MTAGRTAVVAALLLAAGCGGAGSGAEEAAPRAGGGDASAAWTDSAPGVALDSVLRRVAGYVGASRREARQRLGSPVEETRRTAPNRHVRGAVDTIVRLEWRGVSARYLKSGANQREFLASAGVTGDRALARILPPPLRERPGLRRTLGEPDRAGAGRWRFVCCPGRPGPRETLSFRIRDGRVVALEAGFFVD